MRPNIKLLVAYDGTNYLGWQKTRMGPSIEGSLQQTLERILQQPILLQAASRTDAGVHAEGQIVNFIPNKKVDIGKLQHSLNSLLPSDIVVLKISEEREAFHPTLDAVEKEYRYMLCNGPAQLPQKRFYSWHYPGHLDIPLMREAAKALVGCYDFAAFCNVKKNAHYENTIRQVKSIEIEELPENSVRFVIRGANFLYKMVRNIVGTLVYVGCGKLSPDAIPAIIKGLDRTQAGMTAPAHGLFLYRVFYQ